MSGIIRMDYSLLEDMHQIFNDSSEQLKDIAREMQNIAGMLEGGALLGSGGEAFKGAILDKLVPAIGQLQEKMLEISTQVQGALVDMRDADHEAPSRFK
jgi:WXG100 family type VII secretion target